MGLFGIKQNEKKAERVSHLCLPQRVLLDPKAIDAIKVTFRQPKTYTLQAYRQNY